MSDPQLNSIEPIKESIERELAEIKRGLRIWGALDYLMLTLGIVAPLVAAFIGGKSVLEGSPAIKGSAATANSGWAQTCGYIALIALIGAVTNALHKAFKMDQRHSQLTIKKKRLKQLSQRCLHKPNADELNEELVTIMGTDLPPGTA